MKKLYLLLILLVASLSQAQTTVVTATVTFPDANTFQGGTVLATFTPPTGVIDQYLYLLNGSAFPYYVSGTFDGSGTFTMTLTDDHIVRPVGGRWMFTVCSVASIQCTNSLQDVFGASIDLSALISQDVRPIFLPPTNFPTYFNDSEVDLSLNSSVVNGIYFNYVTKNFRCWNGISGSNCLGGGGGGGSVVSFGAGVLIPLFTTSVSNPTTTPFLNFTLSTAPAHTVYANETGSSGLPSFSPDSFTLNTTSPLTGGALVHLGDTITLACPTCSVPQVSVTATSPIVVTPRPGISTFVISCPTCGTSSGSVTSFSSGNLSPLFSTSVTNPTTTPALSFSQVNANAFTVFGNNTGSSTFPVFFTMQGTDTHVLSSSTFSVATGTILCTDANGGATASGCTPLASKKTCTIIIGSDDGAVLVNADLTQGRQCFINTGATIQEVEVAANTGTPAVLLAKNHAGTPTNILSSALTTAGSGGIACSNTGGTLGIDGVTTCTNTLQNTALAAGDYLEARSGTASGTESRMSIFVTFQ